MDRPEFFDVLGLAPPVTVDDIKQAYLEKVKTAHPDRGGEIASFRKLQEAFDQAPQSILTMPILVGTDGTRKMSKTYGNYVGVTEPPEEMFGKLMSIPDAAMDSYYELLLGRARDASAHPGAAKRELARELIAIFHDAAAASAAESRFDAIHRHGRVPDDVPVATFAPPDGDSVHLPALLASEFGVSTTEARRQIRQGGVRVDGERVDPDALDLPAAELSGRVVQLGRRRFVRMP